MRNAVRKFRAMDNKSEATEKLPKLISMIDKLAKKTVIHKNKAGNLKSKLTRFVNRMA
jgi:small subunit ribosomal protein S20